MQIEYPASVGSKHEKLIFKQGALTALKVLLTNAKHNWDSSRHQEEIAKLGDEIVAMPIE